MTAPVPPWPDSVVQGVADVLGDTDTGLTGPEIGRLLAALNIPDPGSGVTKRHRLGHALLTARPSTAAPGASSVHHRSDGPGELHPEPGPAHSSARTPSTRCSSSSDSTSATTARSAAGPALRPSSEAAQHANSLRAELRRRGTHPDVLRYCSDEILTRNVFHAQLEATKSVFDKLRDRTGLTGDGALLVDATLSLGRSGTPVLAINSLATVHRTRRADRPGQPRQGPVRHVPQPRRPRPPAQPHDHRRRTARTAHDPLDDPPPARRSTTDLATCTTPVVITRLPVCWLRPAQLSLKAASGRLSG